MVVNIIHNLKTKMVKSQSLKFGVDRILSEEISPNHENNSTGGRNVEGLCGISSPCGGCLSSIYRCCRTTMNLDLSALYRNEIHTPQPIRPYTHFLVPPETDFNINLQQSNSSGNTSKRKRSWSRAVFSNLQRKGLEKRFQLQKYITKPDRRQLAATLGLTDAQVKVWFQNRRMKWRHTKESTRQNTLIKNGTENILMSADSTESRNTDSECSSDVDVQTVEN